MTSTDTTSMLPLNPADTISSTSEVTLHQGMPVIKPAFDFSGTLDISSYQCSSVFQHHSLRPLNDELLPILDSFNEWFFVVLFLSFTLYAWVMGFNFKRIGQMITATAEHRGFNRLIRDGNIFSEQIFFPLIALIVFCFSLLMYRAGILLDYWEMNEPNAILHYGQILLGFGMLYLVRVVLIKIHAWIFKEHAAAHHYLLNLFVFNTVLSLFFLPLLLVTFFGEPRLQTGIFYILFFLLSGWYIWRWIRSFFYINSLTKFSYVHNFLYLCTLEIGYYLLVYVALKASIVQ